MTSHLQSCPCTEILIEISAHMHVYIRIHLHVQKKCSLKESPYFHKIQPEEMEWSWQALDDVQKWNGWERD